MCVLHHVSAMEWAQLQQLARVALVLTMTSEAMQSVHLPSVYVVIHGTDFSVQTCIGHSRYGPRDAEVIQHELIGRSRGCSVLQLQ